MEDDIILVDESIREDETILREEIELLVQRMHRRAMEEKYTVDFRILLAQTMLMGWLYANSSEEGFHEELAEVQRDLRRRIAWEDGVDPLSEDEEKEEKVEEDEVSEPIHHENDFDETYQLRLRRFMEDAQNLGDVTEEEEEVSEQQEMDEHLFITFLLLCFLIFNLFYFLSRVLRSNSHH
ncbi:MAG: hypothetical protein M1823_006167 [Watsoniomyces obsoletus]|nr:MAG: hypothetical protein M1823_006167 [Watsoniomyces obsoletus]